MIYEVIISAEAKQLIRDQVYFIAVEKSEPQSAAVWFARVYDAISSLEHMPKRCTIAPDNRYTSAMIRMLPVGSHLILFSVDDDAETVNVLSFRAGRELPKRSLGE